MNRFRGKWVTWLGVALLMLILAGGAVADDGATQGQPPDPAPLPPTGDPRLDDILDDIYFGAVPPGGEGNPVLVFVHGYGAAAPCWWGPTKFDGPNDMYIAAYEAGYRTAFVSLDGPEGHPADSMWNNGLLLRVQLDIIAQHYGVDQLDIVAHSKGGVDAQVAIVWFGGWQRVGRLFTLGTPHQGSELADAAYSWWGSWLAELLGFHDDGTYTLQTAYMHLFRRLTDPKAEAQPVRYYTAAGTGWTDPKLEGSVLRLLGTYLSRFGPNDGVVTVDSTALAGAETLFVQPFHHLNIYMGSTAFPWIEEVLTGVGRAKVQLKRPTVGGRVPLRAPESSSILRGGRLDGSVEEVLSLETGVRSVVFDLLTSERAVNATLVRPDGTSIPMRAIAGDGVGLLGTAWHRVGTVQRPPAGQWTVRIDGPPGAAYLLIASVESPVQVTLLGVSEEPVSPGEPLRFSAKVKAPGLRRPVIRRLEVHVTRSSLRRGGCQAEVASGVGTAVSWTPLEEGIYVVSATIRGQTAEGMPFERSFVRSLAVARPETLTGPPTMLDR